MIVRALDKHNSMHVYDYLFLFEDSGIEYIEFLPHHIDDTAFSVVVIDMSKFGIKPMLYIPKEYPDKENIKMKAKNKGVFRFRDNSMNSINSEKYSSILKNDFGEIFDASYDFTNLIVGILSMNEVSAPIDSNLLKSLWIYNFANNRSKDKNIIWWKSNDSNIFRIVDDYGDRTILKVQNNNVFIVDGVY